MKNIDIIFEGNRREELKKYIIKNFCPYQFNIKVGRPCNVECEKCWESEADE